MPRKPQIHLHHLLYTHGNIHQKHQLSRHVSSLNCNLYEMIKIFLIIYCIAFQCENVQCHKWTSYCLFTAAWTEHNNNANKIHQHHLSQPNYACSLYYFILHYMFRPISRPSSGAIWQITKVKLPSFYSVDPLSHESRMALQARRLYLKNSFKPPTSVVLWW
jgi:hypothetical protein